MFIKINWLFRFSSISKLDSRVKDSEKAKKKKQGVGGDIFAIAIFIECSSSAIFLNKSMDHVYFYAGK